MALSRSFEDLVQRHVADDPVFAQALLREGIDTMLPSDVDTVKAILRDYIKARSASRSWARLPKRHPRALFACSGHAATRRPATFSA